MSDDIPADVKAAAEAVLDEIIVWSDLGVVRDNIAFKIMDERDRCASLAEKAGQQGLADAIRSGVSV